MSSTKHVSQRQTLLVFGYIRMYIQPLLSKNETIPHEIIQLCLKYHVLYDWVDFSVYNTEYYDRTMDNSTQILFHKNKHRSSSKVMFSQHGFNEGIHVWKLKCIQYGGDGSDAIGIATNINTNHWFNNMEGETYYTFSGATAYHFKNKTNCTESQRASKKWTINDELIIKLDCNDWTFDVFINEICPDKKCVETFNIIPNKTYYPGIGLPNTRAKYEVLLD
eukprot:317894_1